MTLLENTRSYNNTYERYKDLLESISYYIIVDVRLLDAVLYYLLSLSENAWCYSYTYRYYKDLVKIYRKIN